MVKTKIHEFPQFRVLALQVRKLRTTRISIIIEECKIVHLTCGFVWARYYFGEKRFELFVMLTTESDPPPKIYNRLQ